MANALLRIHVEGGQDLKRMLGQMGADTRRANALTAADARATARVLLGLTKSRVSEETKAAARVAEVWRAAERKIAVVREQAGRAASSSALKDAQTRAMSDQQLMERRMRYLRHYAGEAAQVERQITQNAQREAQTRARIPTPGLGRDERGRFAGGGRGARGGRSGSGGGGGLGDIVNSAASMGGSIIGDLHQQHQDARRQNAVSERAMNTILGQTGASESEMAAMRARIAQFATERHLNLDDTIAATSGAQSRFNALGGRTAEERSRNLEATLNDVEFAHVVDPGNMSAIPAFSAMLRQQGVDAGTRGQMVRAATGISFQGSVETDTALRQGLPAMLRALSSATANARPEERQQITQSAVVDFLAQIQTVAATGGAVGVSGNRMNTLRTALSNDDTQNRLGGALARRLDRQGRRRDSMTDEEREAYDAQRTEFNETFRRGANGRYTMDQAVVNSPSKAAALMGHMFGNDATAAANFLGARGGGGKRQLLNRPEVGLLTSYFAMGQDAEGRQVRQYDAVNSLRNETLSEGRVEELRRVRLSEDQTRLDDAENARRNKLTQKTGPEGWFNRISDWWSGEQASNPFGTALAPVLGGTAAGAGWRGVAGDAGGGVASGALGASSPLGPRASSGGVLAAAALGTVTGRRRGAQSEQDAQPAAVGGGDIARSVAGLSAAVNALNTQLASGNIRATVSLPDAVHAAAEGSGPAGPGPATPAGR